MEGCSPGAALHVQLCWRDCQFVGHKSHASHLFCHPSIAVSVFTKASGNQLGKGAKIAKRTARFPRPMNPRHMSNSQSVSICNQWQKEAPIAPMWSGTPEISCLVCPRLWGCLNTSKSRGEAFWNAFGPLQPKELESVRTTLLDLQRSPCEKSQAPIIFLAFPPRSHKQCRGSIPVGTSTPYRRCQHQSTSSRPIPHAPLFHHTFLLLPWAPQLAFVPYTLASRRKTMRLGVPYCPSGWYLKQFQYLRVSKSFDVFQEASIRFNQH